MVARIVFARTPRVEFRLGRGIERGRQRHDRADIQIGVCPSIQPPADAARERVVDRRVAERAGDADAGELPRTVDSSADADDGVQPQQFDGHGRVGQIDLTGLQRGDDLPRQGLDVDLETNGECCCRRNGGDDFVHPQHAGPQLFVAEGVVAEDALPAPMCAVTVVTAVARAIVLGVESRLLFGCRRARRR